MATWKPEKGIWNVFDNPIADPPPPQPQSISNIPTGSASPRSLKTSSSQNQLQSVMPESWNTPQPSKSLKEKVLNIGKKAFSPTSHLSIFTPFLPPGFGLLSSAYKYIDQNKFLGALPFGAGLKDLTSKQLQTKLATQDEVADYKLSQLQKKLEFEKEKSQIKTGIDLTKKSWYEFGDPYEQATADARQQLGAEQILGGIAADRAKYEEHLTTTQADYIQSQLQKGQSIADSKSLFAGISSTDLLIGAAVVGFVLLKK